MYRFLDGEIIPQGRDAGKANVDDLRAAGALTDLVGVALDVEDVRSGRVRRTGTSVLETWNSQCLNPRLTHRRSCSKRVLDCEMNRCPCSACGDFHCGAS